MVLRDVQQITSIAFSSDGTMLASGGSSHLVQLWNSDTGMKIALLHGPQNVVNSVAFCTNAPCIAAGVQDGSIWFWNTDNGHVAATFKAAHTGPVNSIAFGPEGTRFVSVGNDEKVILWLIPTSP